LSAALRIKAVIAAHQGDDETEHRRLDQAGRDVLVLGEIDGVLEIDRPLHRRIVVVLHADTADAQTTLRVSPAQGVLFALVVQLLRAALELPLAQELG